MAKHQAEIDGKCTFKPSINKKSAAMMKNKVRYTANEDALNDSQGNAVEKPESLHERLYGLSLKQKKNLNDDNSFQPKINKNSSEIVGLMKAGDDYDQNGRWLALC